ncbi:MAG: glycosyltransferase family 4 protein, partial [Pseudomonadota bacterium]|nr:glycosyltransferase family 4 protein [Pseudomonadota bacterium]
MTKTKRVLSLSTLFPNAAHPRFGIFVAKSLEALQQETHWDVTLVNPIGLPPITFGRYRALARAAQDGHEFGFPVHRPVFSLLPKIGGRLKQRLIASSLLTLVQNLQDEKKIKKQY